MFCTHCGEKLDEKKNFCSRCGFIIEAGKSKEELVAKEEEIISHEPITGLQILILSISFISLILIHIIKTPFVNIGFFVGIASLGVAIWEYFKNKSRYSNFAIVISIVTIFYGLILIYFNSLI